MAACCQLVAPFGNGGLFPAAGAAARPRATPVPVARPAPCAALPAAAAPRAPGGLVAWAAGCPPARPAPPPPPHWMITGTLPAAFAGVVTDAAISTLIAG